MRKSLAKISRSLNIQYKNGSKKIWQKFSQEKLFKLIFVFFCFSLFFFFNRGFLPGDEGHMLLGGYRISEGQIIYRDFPFLYPPGTPILVALSFAFFGQSILAGRILTLFVSLLTAFIFYKIGRTLFVKNHFAQLIPPLLYLAWGPTHINFPWPVMFSITTASAAAYLLIRSFEKTKKHYLFWGIFFSLLTFFFKQNFGIAAFLNLVFFYLLLKKRNKIIFLKYFFSNIFFIGTVVFVYLLITNSSQHMIVNLILNPFNWIIMKGIFSTPFVDEPVAYIRVIKIIVYLMPLLISATAIIIIYLKELHKKYLLISTLPMLFYIFGIRPTTDYVHLTPLMSLIGLPLGCLIYAFEKGCLRKITIFAAAVLLIFFGYYTAFFKGYYRWETPLYKQNIYNKNSRVKIFTDEKYSLVLKKIISQSKKGMTRVFIYPNAPLYYFIIGEKKPIESFMKKSENVVEQLKKNNIQTIITHSQIDNEDENKLHKYIFSNFSKIDEFYEYTSWKKN